MPVLTARAAGAILGVHKESIRRWVRQGLLRGYRRGQLRAWVVPLEDVRTFAYTHHYTFDEELANRFLLIHQPREGNFTTSTENA